MNCANWPIFVWLGSVFGYLVQLFYSVFKNYGLAIILFTIATRIIMFPLSIKQQRSMADQQRIQPKLEELKKKYGNDKVAYSNAMQEVYEKEGVSPSNGCLPMLLQFPLFFGMYLAIRRPLYCVLHISNDAINSLAALFNIDTAKDYYAEINIIQRLRESAAPSVISGADVTSAGNAIASVSDIVASASNAVTSASDVISGTDATAVASILGDRYQSVMEMCNSFNFLGFDLLQTASFWNGALLLAFLVFLAQAGSMILTNKINKVQGMNGCSQYGMAIFMGLFSLIISFSIPAAFPLYWLATSVISVAQAWFTREYFGPVVMNAQAEAQRNARLRLNEQAVIDSVTARKGALALKPEMPAEKSKNDSVGEIKKNNSGSKKKNNGGKKGNSNDYIGRKK